MKLSIMFKNRVKSKLINLYARSEANHSHQIVNCNLGWKKIIGRKYYHHNSRFQSLSSPKTNINPSIYQSVYSVNQDKFKLLKKKYEDLVFQAHKGGGERGIQRHVERNKKTLVRERIKKLLDDKSPFLEIGTIAGHDMEYGNIPCAGAVVGIGKIHGVWCMISANDATVKSGSIYPITVKKQLRGQLIAEENYLPTIYLVDSGGAFLPMQAQIFNFGGRAFYNEAVMGSKGIPQVALVCGSCTAGAAYIPSMAEEAIIVDKIGTMYLGGPPLVLAATGENVTPEQLGGATLHCEVSGCTDHFAENEEEGLNVARDVIATSNFHGVSTKLISNQERQTEMQKFAAFSPEYSVSIYEIIESLADNGGFHEYKKRYGSTLVTGFMAINDCLVGVVANDGYLTETAANKGSNFVQLCDARSIPVLFLQNMTFDESERTTLQTYATIKTRAKFLQAIVLCQSPKIVVSVGGLVGSPHMHPMCSLSMGARFHFVWPNVKVGVLFDHDCESDSAEAKYEDYKCQKQRSSAFYGASQMWYDGIVLPEDTREVIYFCLNIFQQESKARMSRPHRSALNKELHTVLRM